MSLPLPLPSQQEGGLCLPSPLPHTHLLRLGGFHHPLTEIFPKSIHLTPTQLSATLVHTVFTSAWSGARRVLLMRLPVSPTAPHHPLSTQQPEPLLQSATQTQLLLHSASFAGGCLVLTASSRFTVTAAPRMHLLFTSCSSPAVPQALATPSLSRTCSYLRAFALVILSAWTILPLISTSCYFKCHLPGNALPSPPSENLSPHALQSMVTIGSIQYTLCLIAYRRSPPRGMSPLRIQPLPSAQGKRQMNKQSHKHRAIPLLLRIIAPRWYLLSLASPAKRPVQMPAAACHLSWQVLFRPVTA